MTDAQENGVKRWRCNCIPVPRQVLAESDHDRVVAHLEVSYQNQIGKLNETIAAQTKVIEKLKEQRDELIEALEFYANEKNWNRDEGGWRHDMIESDLDDETLTNWEGRFSGKRARAALQSAEKEG